MEPQWTKDITSNAICSTYYGIFIFYAVMGAITLLGTIGLVFGVKTPKGAEVFSYGFGFFGIIMALVLFVLSLFQYLVCSRALLGEEVVTVKKGAAQMA